MGGELSNRHSEFLLLVYLSVIVSYDDLEVVSWAAIVLAFELRVECVLVERGLYTQTNTQSNISLSALYSSIGNPTRDQYTLSSTNYRTTKTILRRRLTTIAPDLGVDFVFHGSVNVPHMGTRPPPAPGRKLLSISTAPWWQVTSTETATTTYKHEQQPASSTVPAHQFLYAYCLGTKRKIWLPNRCRRGKTIAIQGLENVLEQTAAPSARLAHARGICLHVSCM